jgi:RNA polymerase sigma factor (sigma-70 family)
MSFPTTSWSLVLAAKQKTSAASELALDKLCHQYWYPVYAYIRCRGGSGEDARDLTQEFFLHLLEKHYLNAIDAPRGRFRWFLQAAVKNFLANEYDRSQTQKRGGKQIFLSLDMARAENMYRLEPVDQLTPEKIFDRRWSLLVLDRVTDLLRQEYEKLGKGVYFDRLQPYLVGDDAEQSYRDLASALSTTEGAIKVAVHRLRRRFAEVLRAEIAETVSNESEIDTELRFLASAIR